MLQPAGHHTPFFTTLRVDVMPRHTHSSFFQFHIREGRCDRVGAIVAEKMLSIASRCGSLSPYLQATNYAVPGPLKALVPAFVTKVDKVPLDVKKPILCRESLTGQSPRTAPAISVGISGEYIAVAFT